MKKFSYVVRMLGFEPVKGTLLARDKKDAEIAAVEIFEDYNDIEDDATESERVKFYGPEIKRLYN